MAAPLRCPNCGTPMNRHAEKVLHDPDSDGAIASVHYCPGCGKVEIVVDPLVAAQRRVIRPKE